MCPPNQIFLFCRYQTKMQIRIRSKKEGVSIYYFHTNDTSPIRENNLSTTIKILAQKCGFKNPDKFINHGNKALSCTIMQNSDKLVPVAQRLARPNFKNEKSGRPYTYENTIAEHRLQNCICAVLFDTKTDTVNQLIPVKPVNKLFLANPLIPINPVFPAKSSNPYANTVSLNQ